MNKERKKPVILFVDDEIYYSKYHIKYLEMKGYPVICYDDFDKCCEDIRKGQIKYDITFIDCSERNNEVMRSSVIMHSRNYSGVDVAEVSKRMNPDAKVVSITGYNSKPKCADWLLVKPFDFKDLEEMIERCCR